MFVIPGFTAVTKPVDGFTVATAVFVLLQFPPAVPSLAYVDVSPMQSGDVPLTVPALTFAFTNTSKKEETGLPHPLLTV